MCIGTVSVGTSYKLRFWYHFRPLSYPDVHVTLMCFAVNNPDSLENITEKWAPEVAHFCPKVPIILVGTKGDLRSDAEALEAMHEHEVKPVTTEDAERVAREIGAHAYMECSAKTRDGVREIFEAAAKLTLKKRRHRGSTTSCGCRLL